MVAAEPLQRRAAAAGLALVARGGRRPGSRRSGCAAAGCRRWWPCCASGRRRRPAAPAPAPGSAGAPPGGRRGRCCGRRRRSAGRRRSSSSTPSSGSRLTSTSRSGRRDAELHEVDQVGAAGQVGRARVAGDQRRPRRPASAGPLVAERLSSGRRRLADRGDDVRVGAAAAQVAAHPFPDLVVGQLGDGPTSASRSSVTGLGRPGAGLVEHPDRGADLAGGAVAALEARRARRTPAASGAARHRRRGRRR